jgi:hypothetical protein
MGARVKHQKNIEQLGQAPQQVPMDARAEEKRKQEKKTSHASLSSF